MATVGIDLGGTKIYGVRMDGDEVLGEEILGVNFLDDVPAWELGGNGCWSKVPTRQRVSTHDALYERAKARRDTGVSVAGPA